jgi:uncharacterized protein with PQ loop repeat
MFMFKGLHHFHKRKRIYEQHEPYPHPDKWKRLMDRLIYFVGVMGPLMSLPQLMNIWVYGNSAGVSAVTWGALAVLSLFWLTYGAMHKEKPIILSSSMWVLFDTLIVIGVLVA